MNIKIKHFYRIQGFGHDPIRKIRKSVKKGFSFMLMTFSIIIIILNIQGCKKSDRVEYHGRILLSYYGDVFELTEYSDSVNFNLLKIAENAYNTSVSPDYKYFVYCSDTITFLRDLSSGKVTRLFDFLITNVSWSADASKFSYQMSSNKDQAMIPQDLFVYHVKREYSQLICESPTMIYDIEGNIGIPSVRTLRGNVSSGKWLDSFRIVFQRVPYEDFPKRISSNIVGEYSIIPSTITTIAELNETVKFTDLGERKWIKDIGDDGSWALYSKFETLTEYGEVGSNTLFLTNKILSNFEGDSYPIDCNQYEMVGFIKHSSKLFYLKKINFWGHQSFLIVDPQNLKVISKLILEQYGYMRGNDFIMDQSKNFIAYFDGPEIKIYDINTGNGLTVTIGLPKILTYNNLYNGDVLALLNE